MTVNDVDGLFKNNRCSVVIDADPYVSFCTCMGGMFSPSGGIAAVMKIWISVYWTCIRDMVIAAI